MHLSWEDIRTVEALVRLGGISAAARELGLRHTSISRRIDALEQALAAPLFLRGARLRPTALAVAIAARAAPMAEQARSIDALVEAAGREREGRLSITTNDVLAPLLFRALAAHPLERRVEVRISDVEASLEPGIADLALRPGSRPEGTLRGWRLGRLVIGVYRAVDAHADAWILPSPAMRRRSSMRWWKAVPDDPAARIECDSLLALRDACVEGHGRAALPALLGEDPRLRLEGVVEGGPPVWLLAPATKRTEPGLRALAAGLAAAIRAMPGIWAP